MHMYVAITVREKEVKNLRERRGWETWEDWKEEYKGGNDEFII